mgnify:CR=1 FL=1
MRFEPDLLHDATLASTSNADAAAVALMSAQRTKFQLRRPSEREGGVRCKPELGGHVNVRCRRMRRRHVQAFGVQALQVKRDRSGDLAFDISARFTRRDATWQVRRVGGKSRPSLLNDDEVFHPALLILAHSQGFRGPGHRSACPR